MEADVDSASSRGRVQRALALIAGSLLALASTGILYLHPSLPSLGLSGAARMPVLQGSYTVSALDFIDPSTGWIAAQFASGDVAILHTTDAGRSWKAQLSAHGNGHAQYLKFFDSSIGVFALLGGGAILHRTFDGGATWTSIAALADGASVLSWSFVDSVHGWMLAREPGETPDSPPNLYRTGDRGRTWTSLGEPVKAPDQAYQVHFAFLTSGWLATSGPRPNAYRSEDFGDTWERVALPSPLGAWPASGQYFVGVQPTLGIGALASVVYFPAIKGRSGVGGSVRAFPPLTVRVFDGGKPDTYTYSTVLDRLSFGGRGGRAGAGPANETVMSTLDNGRTWTAIRPPLTTGAIGYFDADDWWWIGAGTWSRTGDGGITWTDPENLTVTEPLPGSLQVLDASHAWFASSAASRPILEATDDAGLHWRVVSLPTTVDVATP